MAIINCPNCGANISGEAKKCPNCGKRLKKRNVILPLIIGIILIIICVGAYAGKQYQINQEKKINNILAQVDILYSTFSFDEIEKCYDQLDALHYDTAKQRKLLEYDKEVYPAAYAYYQAITDADNKLHSGKYNSLDSMINGLKTPTKNFEALEINTDSEIGKYINNVRNNFMYITFNAQFVNADLQYSLDYYLTSGGYVIILETYTEEIVKEKFPYIKDE